MARQYNLTLLYLPIALRYSFFWNNRLPSSFKSNAFFNDSSSKDAWLSSAETDINAGDYKGDSLLSEMVKLFSWWKLLEVLSEEELECEGFESECCECLEDEYWDDYEPDWLLELSLEEEPSLFDSYLLSSSSVHFALSFEAFTSSISRVPLSFKWVCIKII